MKNGIKKLIEKCVCAVEKLHSIQQQQKTIEFQLLIASK